MAEAIVSVVLQELTSFIFENAQQELGLLTGVEREVQNLENNLKAIQAVLKDAEVKQMQSEGIKLWLERLKDVSYYDMEDELDEWNTRVLKSKINASSSKRKVFSQLPNFSFGQVLRRHHVATRIKEINEELDQIAKQKDRYQLASREMKQPRSRESVSFVDVSILHGRDKDKEKIIRFLLSGSGTSEASDIIPTISVVGMGGIGETALAQLVYNDNDIQAHFHERIWIRVSNDFVQTKVARDIIAALAKHDISLPSSISLQSLLNRIRNKIESKKFLLVLDDVWTEHDEDWGPIEATLKYGMLGSRILVTTHKESVAKKMKSSCIFQLQMFPDEECWRILSKVAFYGRDRKECEKLKDIGREIAKKSEGLPLVAKTLAGLLQEKETRQEWENILHSEIWKLSLAQEYIFTPLHLSYYDLPFPIKQCLLFCAIFPKDFPIPKFVLIFYWSAQGYLNCDDENSEMELIGEGYFKCLVARSFFQDFVKLESGIITTFKMHDIVHDFLQFLTKNEFVMEVVNKVEEWMLNISSKKARHLMLTFPTPSNHFPMSIKGQKSCEAFSP